MNWKFVKLGELLTESKIESIKSDPGKRITVRLNLKGVEKRPYEKGVEGATKYFVRKAGQFIYGKQNLFKGAFGIIPKELDGFESSSDIPAFDIDKKCLPEWLIYYLRQSDFYLSLESIATGTGSRRIQPARLFEIDIPLPSIKEQKKIIDYCNLIEKKYGRINEELIQQQTYLQQLRQSILQEAVRGKLSEPGCTGLKDFKMNGENKILPSSNLKNHGSDNNDEDAATLLKRIKAEKQKLIKEGKLKKEKELPPITEDEIPFELPKGWVWCRLGEVTRNIDYGTSEKATLAGEVPILRMGNVQEAKIVFDNLKYVRRNIKDLPRLFLKKKDLIFNRTNSYELVGKCGIFEGEDDEYTLASYLIRVSIPTEMISVDYVNFYINSKICRETQIEPQITQQTGQANFSGSKLKNILFPLPPFAEQQRIVAKVGKLQQQLSELESEVQQSREYAQQLLQAVLKEAFEEKGTVYEENEMVTMVAED